MGDVNRSIGPFGVPRDDQESIDSFVRPYFLDSGPCLCGIHHNASTSAAATTASHHGTHINKIYRCMSIFFMVMQCLVMAACGFLLYKFQDLLQGREKTDFIGKDITNDEPIAAHLNINSKGKWFGKSSTLTWKEDGRYGHMHGVELEDDKYLVINSSGYYYVYSQILFSKHIDGSVGSFVLHHYIVKKNPTLPRENGLRQITHNEHKIANLSNDLIQHTSYTGLIVKLTIGDKIYVSASNSSLIEDSDTVSSFFGLYKVR